ncbi:hypothetical protein CY35_06G048100 [Sphagnum magellanicum]|nr:hypothetical protein CY35_06G048100 [Sphagnum magellanicum]
MKSVCPMDIISTRTRSTGSDLFNFSLELQLTNLACLEFPSTSTQSITTNLRDRIPRFTQTISTPATEPINSMQTSNYTSRKHMKPNSRMLTPHLLYRTD